MSNVVLTKKSGDDGDLVPPCTTLTITNFNSLDFNLITPVSEFPIPELPDECAILVKAEGNTLTINVAWTIKDETFDLSSEASPATKTVQEQLSYILDRFQPQSIEDSYEIQVDGITRAGFPRNWNFTKSSNTPVTYEARFEFIAGDLVAGD